MLELKVLYLSCFKAYFLYINRLKFGLQGMGCDKVLKDTMEFFCIYIHLVCL